MRLIKATNRFFRIISVKFPWHTLQVDKAHNGLGVQR